MTSLPQDLLSNLLDAAKLHGADQADAVYAQNTALSVEVRLGKVEMIERSESADIGLRVIKGKKQAVVSTSDLRPESLKQLAAKALDMAQATPDNPYVGLAQAEELAIDRENGAFDMADPAEPDARQLTTAALEAEAAGMAVAGITNSNGADASFSRSQMYLMASNGLSVSMNRTSCGLSATVIAGEGTSMERDYDYDSAVYWSDLRDPAEIGRKAASRTIASLNPGSINSAVMPVVVDPQQARDFLGIFLSAINGGSITRKASFLMDSMGKQVFAPNINIVEDPHVKRGFRSRRVDTEGLPTRQRHLIEDGKLTTWLLDLKAARQLDLAPTGHAVRGVGSAPSPQASNVWMEAGQATPEELMGDIKQGFYLTHILGHDLNLVTGDYSRGARGFLIENGKITRPVSGVTIAGNLRDMFAQMQPANDLIRRFGMDAPTLRIEGMTVAGK